MATSTKSIVEGAFLISITVIMYLLGIYNAAFGFISTLFCPVPIILLVLRHEQKIVLSGFFVSVLILSGMAGILEAVYFFIQLLLPGFVMGYYIKKDSSIEKVIGITAIVFVAGTIILMSALSQILQKDFLNEMFTNMENLKETYIKLYQDKGVDAATIAQLKNILIFYIKMIKQIYPSIFIFCVIFLLIFNYEVARKIIIKLGHTIKPLDMLNLRVPEYLIWGFIISFVFAFVDLEKIIMHKGTQEVIRLIALNILVFFVIMYFFQGLYIAVLYMKKWKFPKFFIIVNFIMFFIYLQFVPLLLGVFDFWFDFRTRIMKSGDYIERSNST
ncbi:DUF2232 domain-containing protein [Candidatus Desantisbacteria bacterium]|nr:DUF2232 domain-containing protein [Candidatus Desantisbacteria bacterium]